MDNKTMMQYFEWYLPDNGLLWKKIINNAQGLKDAGINMIWLPPSYKGASGKSSVGYDVYDTYDLGEFDQKGSVSTKYGTRQDYLQAVKVLKENNIQVITDIVLNHMMGADECEQVMVTEDDRSNRELCISDSFEISAWTKFNFPGRNGKYSKKVWDASNFSGTDWDNDSKRNGIFLFDGKNWNKETDSENVNYDYLMGADLDTDNEDTVKAVTDWGKWYYDTVEMDGLRLDAVKHISFDFYKNWLKNIRQHAGKELFAVGEYWAREVDKMTHYLDVVDNSMSLFDVTLHYSFLRAATSNGNFDMSTLFADSLVKARPDNAVTFVDNHDTQPGQALYSFIPEWFKTSAYSLILLHKDGIPCVFYGDYYGIVHDHVKPVEGLRKLIKIREKYAYGEQIDYFDNCNQVGFTRMGDEEHPNSGLALIVTDETAGTKRMKVGKQFSGKNFFDALGHINSPVTIDEEGFGEFMVIDGSVSVWLVEEAYDEMFLYE